MESGEKKLLIGIDRQLAQRAKVYAVASEITLKELTERALREKLEREGFSYSQTGVQVNTNTTANTANTNKGK